MTTPPDYDPLDDGSSFGRGGVPRDRYDRPLLIPPGGGARIPYTSMSTLSEALGDTYGLDVWDRRMIAHGLGMERELAALAGALEYNTGLGDRDEGKNRANGRELDEIIDRARDAAKAHQKRDYGSAFHLYTEPDQRVPPPDYMAADVDSFWAALKVARITLLDTELFVANEELVAAGTFDHLAVAPWRPLPFIIDKKTGVYHPEKDKIQIAGYAGGVLYDPDTDERTTFEEKYGMEVDRTWGLTAHTAAESGETILYPQNLVEGHEAALQAIWVREYRKANRKSKKTPVLDPQQVMVEWLTTVIETVQQPTRAWAKALWSEHKDVWTDELMGLAWKAIRERGTGE